MAEGSDNLITWNVTNWVTVIVMAIAGFAALAVLAKLVAKYRGGKSDESSES